MPDFGYDLVCAVICSIPVGKAPFLGSLTEFSYWVHLLNALFTC